MNNRRFYKSRIVGLTICIILTSGLSGCKKNPQESIVKNKDMDKLIEEAKKSDEEGLNLEEAGRYKEYKTSINNEALGVSVEVDAKVDIPETDKLSMYRVEQQSISQEMLDVVRKELARDISLYNGEIIEVYLKENIETRINGLRESINSLYDENNMFCDDDIEVYEKEYQDEIDRLEELYKKAPEKYIFSKDGLSDGKIKTVKDMYNKDKTNEFWKWVYEINPKGDVYYGVSDGTDGMHHVLYSHTSNNWGNVIRYRKCAYGYEEQTEQVSKIDKNGRCKGTEVNEGELQGYLSDFDSEEINILKESTTISKEEAINVADNFLKNIGLEEFKCYEGDIYTEHIRMNEYDGEDVLFRTYYILTYMRTVNGVFVTVNNLAKNMGDSYKAEWPVEEIEIRVNDDGIVGFDYVAPLTITEVLVEDAYMKSYEEIQKTFEDMVPVKYATENNNEKMEINVDKVTLGYARICEQDSLTTGLLVPIWDFKGSMTLLTEGYNRNCGSDVMSINAIDGTVIDLSVGY